MSKPSTYLFSLVIGVFLGWLAQQFWSAGLTSSNLSRDSLMSQNEARLQHLKAVNASQPDKALKASPVNNVDRISNLLASNNVEAAAELFRESWDDFSPNIELSRLVTEKWLGLGEYEAAFTLLYDQRLFVSFEQEPSLLAFIYAKVESVELKLSEKKQLSVLIDLYRLLVNLHADYTPYYLRLSHWQIENGDFDGAEQSLYGALNDVDYQEDVERLALRIEQADSNFGVIMVPIKKVGEHYVVEVIINDAYTMNLMLDTGATMSVLKTSLVEIGLPGELEHGDLLIMNTANGSVEGVKLPLESFSIGGQVLKGINVGVVPLPGFKFDGLLGMNVLSRFDFFIDQEQKVLALNPRVTH